MLLEEIRNFDWINEPKNVEFIEKGLLITTKPHTDFWQNSLFGISKEDGHFFACNKNDNFTVDAKWSFEKTVDSAQCGVMIRYDSKNWIKAGLLPMGAGIVQLGVVVANNGYCDWSTVSLSDDIKTINFRVKRRESNFVVYYALDDEKYAQIRVVNHSEIKQPVEVGAYACSPKDESFDCVLEEIKLSE